MSTNDPQPYGQQPPPPPPSGGQGYDRQQPPQPHAGQPAYPDRREEPGADDRALTVLAHLSAPIAAVISLGWLTILGPLVIWLIYKDRSQLVRKAAAGAFNFNLMFWVLYLISWLLIFTLIGALIGIPMLILIFVVSAIMHIVGAVRGAKGEQFTYPFQIPVLR
ncbi:MAG: DUF4870 domain-containing protein [Actinomycetota bacterium]|jgi:uncharacterized Tic20 family protein|nr:DUF4870 domain-containing protein [Actinomycetota bacterium]